MKRMSSRKRVVGTSLALVAVCVWCWNSGPINLRDRIFPKHFVEVYPGELYRSGQIAPNLIEATLRENRIDVVLDLSHDRGSDDPEQQAEQLAVGRLGIDHVRVPLRGSGRGSAESYAAAVTALARAATRGQRVLVHCRAGDRRTGGVIAAYQLLVRRETADAARVELTRFARRSPDSSGLTSFLDATIPEIGRILLRNGVISSVPRPLPELLS